MFKKLHYKVRGLPTPLAGLALGIASLGWCLENALPLAGWGQTTGAVIGLVMIGFLVLLSIAQLRALPRAGPILNIECFIEGTFYSKKPKKASPCGRPAKSREDAGCPDFR